MGNSTPDKPFGFYDATVGGGWQVPGEPYTTRPHPAARGVQVVAAADAGRAHQPLGPDLAPQRAVRLQAALPRRAGLRLADLVRGRRALLHEGRDADRRLRHQRGAGEHAELARGRAAAGPQGPGGGTAGAEARQGAGHPHRPDPPRRADQGAGLEEHPRQAPPRRPQRPEDRRRGDAHAPGVLLGDALRARAARSPPTTSPPPSTCRRPWRRATSTSSPTPTPAK